jgi:hypothetical protein
MPNDAGKGDKPRNCFSKDFKDNYDCIVWRNKSQPTTDLETNVQEEDSNQVHSIEQTNI